MANEYVCVVRIDFTDGGPAECEVIHTGSLEECERAADDIPGVTYTGKRPVKQASTMLVPKAVWDVEAKVVQ